MPQPAKNQEELKQRFSKMSLDYAEYVDVSTALLLKYVDTFISYNQRKCQLNKIKENLKDCFKESLFRAKLAAMFFNKSSATSPVVVKLLLHPDEIIEKQPIICDKKEILKDIHIFLTVCDDITLKGRPNALFFPL